MYVKWKSGWEPIGYLSVDKNDYELVSFSYLLWYMLHIYIHITFSFLSCVYLSILFALIHILHIYIYTYELSFSSNSTLPSLLCFSVYLICFDTYITHIYIHLSAVFFYNSILPFLLCLSFYLIYFNTYIHLSAIFFDIFLPSLLCFLSISGKHAWAWISSSFLLLSISSLFTTLEFVHDNHQASWSCTTLIMVWASAAYVLGWFLCIFVCVCVSDWYISASYKLICSKWTNA